MSDSVVPLWFHFTSLFGVMLLASYLCGKRLAKIISLADAQLKAEREKALREAAEKVADLYGEYSEGVPYCDRDEAVAVIEALISEGATDGVERKRK